MSDFSVESPAIITVQFGGAEHHEDGGDVATLPRGELTLKPGGVEFSSESSLRCSFVGVRITLLEAGGRTSPTPRSEFRCAARVSGALYDARWRFEHEERLSPGDTAMAIGKFVDPDVVPSLVLGETLELVERRVIGHAEVVALL